MSSSRRPVGRPASRPGTARRQRPQPAPVVAAATPRSLRSRFTGRAAVMVLVALVLVISYASSMRAWLQQRADLSAARADIARADVSIAQLEQTRRRLKDPAYVEQQARERFSWVNPGEVGYRVIGTDGRTLGTDERLQAPAAGQPPQAWYSQLAKSVEVAGRPEQVPTQKPPPSSSHKVLKADRRELIVGQ